MQFADLNLNLLRIFVVLIDEGSATRAASRLNLSPSAVSHALARLRQALGDPLFSRGSTNLRATPRALEIAPAIRRIMEDLEGTLSITTFDPATTDRQFEVVASAYASSVLLPAMARAFQQTAPRAKLRVRGASAGIVEALDRGQIDVVVCASEQIPSRFNRTPLFDDTAVWVTRCGHPAAAGGLSIKKLSKLSRIAVSALDPWNGVDDHLEGLGFKHPLGWSDDYMKGMEGMPEATIKVPDVHAVLAMVLETDLTALLPRRLADHPALAGKLAIMKPVGKPAPTRISGISLKTTANNSAVAWLMNLMRSAVVP